MKVTTNHQILQVFVTSVKCRIVSMAYAQYGVDEEGYTEVSDDPYEVSEGIPVRALVKTAPLISVYLNPLMVLRTEDGTER